MDGTIFNLADFKDVFSSDSFSLPIRWDGKDFLQSLRRLYEEYKNNISTLWHHTDAVIDLSPRITHICDEIIRSIEIYLNGKPSDAHRIFDNVFLEYLMTDQFSIYNTLYDPAILEQKGKTGRSKLFRVRFVKENKLFNRNDIFHTPFSLRNKVATSRYSIAGYPSLYLSTSLELCLEELGYELNPGRYICSRFEMVNESRARIIELGIKPEDFYSALKENNYAKDNNASKRYSLVNKNLLSNPATIRNYYIWFPLIAACSFMRINKEDPFAVEYVVPQLLMQSVRKFRANGVFMGIRYFSCSSHYSSELGFNYVFPTNYDGGNDLFCQILSKAFLLTKPIFLNEYKKISDCETALRNGTTGLVNT